MLHSVAGQGANFATATRVMNTGNNVPDQVLYDGGTFDVTSYPGISGIQTGDIPMSTGSSEGDGNQASHFLSDDGGLPTIGIMDPTIGAGQLGIVTENDLRVLGLIGWDWIDTGLFGTPPTVAVEATITSDTTPALAGTVSETDAQVFVRLPTVMQNPNQATLTVDGNSAAVYAFALQNATTSTANIVRAELTLPDQGVDGTALVTPYFDTVGLDFLVFPGDDTIVGLLSPEADSLNDSDVVNLSKTLTMTFGGFEPGEEIRWAIDMDFGTAGVVTGDMIEGSWVTVFFDNGLTASGNLAAIGAINPDASTITVSEDHALSATNNGDGTWTLADNLLPVLSLGSYDVEVTVIDSSGAIASNSLTGGLAIELAGDVNQDATIDRTDVVAMLSGYGKAAGASWGEGDVSGDGKVGLVDLAELQSQLPASTQQASSGGSGGGGGSGALVQLPGGISLGGNLGGKTGSGLLTGGGGTTQNASSSGPTLTVSTVHAGSVDSAGNPVTVVERNVRTPLFSHYTLNSMASAA